MGSHWRLLRRGGRGDAEWGSDVVKFAFWKSTGKCQHRATYRCTEVLAHCKRRSEVFKLFPGSKSVLLSFALYTAW